MDKLIERFIDAWEKYQDNKLAQGVIVAGCLLLVALTTFVIYLYWWVILIIGAIITKLAVEENRRKAAQALMAQRRTHNLMSSSVYTFRHALVGLEGYLGIFNTPDKGFSNIISRTSKNGVVFLRLLYLRLPNLPSNAKPEECEQLRNMLNVAVQREIKSLPFENVTPINVYVAEVQVKDEKLVISVIPIICDNSRAEVDKHRRWVARKAISGKSKKGEIAVNNGERMIDDEL